MLREWCIVFMVSFYLMQEITMAEQSTKGDIRAVFFDVDGTLLSNDSNSVPESARAALRELRRRGIKVVIATARHMSDLEKMPVNDMEFDGYVVLNGQLICGSDHKMYAGKSIDRGEMEVLSRIFEAKKIPFVMVTENDSYINYVNDTVKETQEEFHDDVPETGRYYGENVYQIMAFVSEKEKQLLDDLLDECAITSWSDSGIDIIPRDGGKTAGIQIFLDENGIDRSETMAFGDGENDIEMLEYVGIGVAMGNGKEKVKAAADYVTDTVENNGIEKALKHFGLIGDDAFA